MPAHILPDSRPRERKGSVVTAEGTYIPIYCANCGKKWGMVPEKYITFAFALCDPCAETHGDIAHCYKEPDSAFWERIRDAQLEEHQRMLTPQELVAQLDDPTSSIAKLAKEWRVKVEKTG